MNMSLRALEGRIKSDLDYVDYPSHSWVIPRAHASGAKLYDVVIVGAGMSGLSIAFLLLRSRIVNILVIDRSAKGQEGPWVTYARMEHLRTPKELVGPDCGFPSLSFAAWYRAQFGEDAWRKLEKAPCDVWMNYLNWFRDVAALPVENGVDLERIEPQPDRAFLLRVSRNGVAERIHTRKVVLATGFCAAGGLVIPEIVKTSLPPDRYAHSAGNISATSLRGKRIAVLGAGASAFDCAAVALEAGARDVTLFARRRIVEKQNVKEAAEFSTLLRHYADLDDARRWRLMRIATNDSPPPPPSSIARCTMHPNFALHTGAMWTRLEMADDQILITSSGKDYAFDFLLLGTGFRVEMSERPEISSFADEIAQWRDVYTPPPDAADEALGRYPYLGRRFEYVEKRAGRAPFLASIYDFGLAAIQSMGPICVGLNGMKIGAPRLVEGISRSLFLDDAPLHEAALAQVLRA